MEQADSDCCNNASFFPLVRCKQCLERLSWSITFLIKISKVNRLIDETPWANCLPVWSMNTKVSPSAGSSYCEEARLWSVSNSIKKLISQNTPMLWKMACLSGHLYQEGEARMLAHHWKVMNQCSTRRTKLQEKCDVVDQQANQDLWWVLQDTCMCLHFWSVWNNSSVRRCLHLSFILFHLLETWL